MCLSLRFEVEHIFIREQINILQCARKAKQSAPSEIGSSFSSTVICPIFCVTVPLACLSAK